jgi:two-component system probable response regulator PhcQ
MKPDKILFVDDEAMALKYFERLVSPLAPVITAGSVDEGKAVLRDRGAEIAVLVSDQRMPGERGNELLRHAREHHPHIVRMLTTAYSELGEAIEAINSGEIYRYINKPWDLESLRADLKHALELADLRNERDGLVRDKLLAQQSQLLANRLGGLLMLGAAVRADGQGVEAAIYQFAQAALLCRPSEPAVDWHRWEHADLLQAEAQRGAAIAAHLRHWLGDLGARMDGEAALSVLARAVGGELQGDAVLVRDALPLTALLTAPAGSAVSSAQCFWLAWLLWQGGQAQLHVAEGGWRVTLASAVVLRGDWLADAMERLGRV